MEGGTLMDITKNLEVGEEFAISLEENPTTGYRWETSFDSSFLELTGKKYQRKGRAIGGGGTIEFKFLSLKMGKTVLQLRLLRSWEGEPIKILDYEIVIS